MERIESWKIRRAGVINFWYYDEAYFEFSDGRLLLRGANGSGKSVTMQSLVPLLFDGNKSPERLDPFGSRARRMESYLLSDGLDLEERTGYLFLEFQRESSASHLTIGMGMRARKNMALQSWYFLVLDGRRIGPGFDFNLYKDLVAKLPLTAKELENKIGEGGRVFLSQKEYRTAVNDHLFGFSDIGEFEELIELLIQLRSPKLSKEFKPTTTYEIMQNSLQTLSDEDLRPMSDSIVSMDEIKTRIEDLDRAKKALSRIETVYDKYNALQITSKAQLWIQSQEKLAAHQEASATRQSRKDQLQLELEEDGARLDSLKLEEASLRDKEQSLRAHDIGRIIDEQQTLVSTLARLESSFEEKNRLTDQHKSQERDRYKAFTEKQSRIQKSGEDLDRTLAQMDGLYEDMAFDEHGFFAAEYRAHLAAAAQGAPGAQGAQGAASAPTQGTTSAPEFNLAYLDRQLSHHESALKSGVRLLADLEVLEHRHQLLFDEAERARSNQEGQEKTLAQTRQQLARIKDEYVEKLFAWHGGLSSLGIQIDRKAVTAAAERAQAYGDTFFFDDLIAPLRNAMEDALGPLREQYDQLQLARQDDLNRLAEQKTHLAELHALDHIQPPRTDQVLRNRKRLTDNKIPFLPLYLAIDFKKDVDSSLQGHLEEALLELGLLDALLVPPAYRDQIMAQDPGMADKYLFADPELFRYNLSEYLKTDPAQTAIAPELIQDVLQSCFLDQEEGSASKDRTARPVISERGQYGMGILRGFTSQSRIPSLVGPEARKRHKQDQIQQTEQRIQEFQEAAAAAKQAMDALEQTRRNAYEALEQFPKTVDLDLAYRETGKEETELSRLVSILEARIREAQQLYEQVSDLRIQAQKEYGRLGLALKQERFLAAAETAAEYKDLLNQLRLHDQQLRSSRMEAGSLAVLYQETLDRIEEYTADCLELERQIRQTRMRLADLKDQMELSDHKQLQEELAACLERLAVLPGQREELVRRIASMEAEHSRLSQDAGKALLEGKMLALRMELYDRALKAEWSLGHAPLPESGLEGVLTPKVVAGLLKQTGTGAIHEDRRQFQTMRDDLQERLLKESSELAEFNLKRKDLFGEFLDWLEQQREALGAEPEPAVGQEPGPASEWEEFFEELAGKALELRRFEIIGRFGGKEVRCQELSFLIQERIQEQGRLLDEQDRELFEEILIKSISRKISARIWHSQQWVEKINDLMESMDTSSGMVFHLNWDTKKAESEDQLDTRELVGLLKMDPGLLSAEDKDRLIRHFRSKIQESRARALDQSDHSSFLGLMKEILDYRKWFEFRLFFTKKGDRRKELTNHAFFIFSGGEKAMAMYVPLFSAVYAKYRGADPGCPKVLSLDEAFAGVDERNIRDMFRLLIQLDLGFIANSQALYGDYETVPSLSIYELIRPENVTFVTSLRYHWNGRERILVEEEV